ncbi:MAG: Peptide chain release factor 1 [Chlamydiae bacterium]|nr:Peptide chain release factor 1 [Chlamydiota bacterium]
MFERVLQLVSRFGEVEKLLGDPGILSDKAQYKELTQEHAYLTEVKEAWDLYQNIQKQLEENRELLKEVRDEELILMLKEEIDKLEKQEIATSAKIETLLVPPDPNDHRNTILEVRAGTGGDEAALFVGDIVRMYQQYAAINNWKWEPLSCAQSEMGGYKEYIMALSGPNVHRMLQYEAGIHRVQRVPATETQGRVHTSAVTVAVLMEPDEEEKVELNEKDLKIDTYRASGAGGQHVNTTDSAVRITHIPTGIVTCCQDERSQHKNKDRAMRLLSAKIADEKRKKAHMERAELRQSQVGTGDRSDRIRTYNFSQNRVSDHRIDLTLYKLEQVLSGELDEVIQPLVSYYYAQKLAGK